MSPPFKALAALSGAALLALGTSARAVVVTASYSSSGNVPLTAASYTATGNTVDFALNFAPPVGAKLTVVENTGLAFIQGTFDNLAQGQRVNLTFGGISYPFVANYCGGTGNDLVLQWANVRPLAWGGNQNGELGIGDTVNKSSPMAVITSGVLAGKVITAIAAGRNHNLALTADGVWAAWGSNSYGQLGDGTNTSRAVPVAVDQSGVLAGKTVIAVAAGGTHSLVLCHDGTLAAWGANSGGQLGTNNTNSSAVPVGVDLTGVLAGKSVVAVSAGGFHNLVLCADGTLAAWGQNYYGQLGNNTSTQSKVPVRVDQTGVLAGKTVIAIATGRDHSLALAADGTLATWGNNAYGQLGDGSTTSRLVPVRVTVSGVLAGKTPLAVAAGSYHSLVWCADGTFAAWGNNLNFQLGNGGNSNSDLSLPALVIRTGELSGKTVTAFSGGDSHSLALCSDGSLTAWGSNGNGQMGIGGTGGSNVPVRVSTSGLQTGERFVAVGSGLSHSLALLASPPPAQAATLAPTTIRDSATTLHGSVNANGSSTAVSFQYGPTTAYGVTVEASPATLTGVATTAVSVNLSGLPPGITYHYRVVATSAGGTVTGEDMTFTTTDFTMLTGLDLSTGTLLPGFSGTNRTYAVTLPFSADSLTVTPVLKHATSTAQVNGAAVTSGTASSPVNLAPGNNPVNIRIAAADGVNTETYAVIVTRLPQTLTFGAATDVPVTAEALLASGNQAAFELTYAPMPGTSLTVVNNTGPGPIQGAFDNVAQNQQVDLTYGGISYPFVADYCGGTGNDLVLRWANTRVLGWGSNYYSQLGNDNPTDSLVPTPVNMTGILAGKTVLAVAAGGEHNLALCTDGTLVSWGRNILGQLGNNGIADSRVPVWVDQTGVLAGKTVIAMAGGGSHSVVLCADGTLAAWGDNSLSQLGGGNSIGSKSSVPVLANRTGVLAGKTIIAIAAGSGHTLVLCEDGTLGAWGSNNNGGLGNGTTTASNVPVLVERAGVLAGKTIVAIAAGGSHSLALCADGTLAAWGYNTNGELGNANTDRSTVPVAVVRTGVLAGKTIVAIAAGNSHSLALCADGALAAWGDNFYGQLGIGNTARITVPVLVGRTGVLAGKTITAIAAGGAHSQVLCADGTLAAWGFNGAGQLGDGSTTNSSVPVAVTTATFRQGERIITMAGGSSHSLALTALPPPPLVTTLAASGVTDTDAALHASVNANGASTSVTFEYGLTSAYGMTAAATPNAASGTTSIDTATTLSGLLSGTTYHYRVSATSEGGTRTGADLTFTTSEVATLASLTLDSGTLDPAFAPVITRYAVTLPFATTSLTVMPVVAHAGATVTVNGTPVMSGNPAPPLDLATGDNPVAIVVTAADGVITETYRLVATRLPQIYRFTGAGAAAVTVTRLAAAGSTADIELAYAPVTGTNLTVVNNTGPDAIQGTFDNLAHGQTVNLGYDGVTYPFVANYFGGTGNDLVLQWANIKPVAWGDNSKGQLGDGTTVSRLSAVPVDRSGVLAGRTVLALAGGGSHSLALCADGTLAAWGSNSDGQLGNGTTTSSSVPVLVSANGASVLKGKTITAIAAGSSHSLALCADGTLATWGNNEYGQLGVGNNSSGDRHSPGSVDRTGVLAGKTIVAISAADSHTLVLCGDGTMAAWGYNMDGRLGSGIVSYVNRVPVAVNTTGVLAGKPVTAIAAGSFALCADGTLATWGPNSFGQLGDGTTTQSGLPVLVNRYGVLAGRTATAISGKGGHCLALCADGFLAAWGNNAYGQLGDGATTNRLVPVLAGSTAALTGKTIIDVFGGGRHSLALCSDGTLAAWGYNNLGQLGDGTTVNSLVPVTVSGLGTGERFVAAESGYSHNLALVAMPPPVVAVTLAATGVTDTGATLHGSVNPNGDTTAVSFEYGPATAYGATLAATQPTVTGTSPTPVSTTAGGLLSGTTYHYRVVATSAGGTVRGEDLTFTTSSTATLAALSLSAGALEPSFDGTLTSYIAMVSYATDRITVTPVCESATATLKVNGLTVASGAASAPVDLAVGNNPVTIEVAAAGGGNSKTYTVTVTRLPETFSFSSASTVPVTVAGFVATGHSAELALAYAPVAGTVLTVVRNTGSGAIRGTFDNLAQGQRVNLTYGGISYPFVANYFGGTGNDLVLHWANTRVLAWGYNGNGQLGRGDTDFSSVPVPTDMTGVLAGRTIIALAAGSAHNLALCADGTLAAWGSSDYGRLGNGYTTDSKVPVSVDRTGVLAGKVIIAIAAGTSHSLALCADGTLAAWGYNYSGQLGNGNSTNSSVPVLVNREGVLVGKTVTAIAAGGSYNLALCADGTLAGWGNNGEGQLGNGITTDSYVPVLVDRLGVLAGKTVIAISAGGGHNLVLCADGTLAAWGSNYYGQIGDGSSTSRSGPVLVNRTGVLAGRTVTAISAANGHSLVLCADGALAAWGFNTYGQLGNNSSTNSSVPVLVNASGVLVRKSVVAVAGGGAHSIAWCSDGNLVAWGDNSSGQLGNNSSTNSSVPVLVNASTLPQGQRFTGGFAGGSHSLALVAMPPPPQVATLAASGITDGGGTLNGSVSANASATSVSFQYGLAGGHEAMVAASPANLTGTAATGVSVTLGGLLAGTTYHYRVIATSAGGTVAGELMTFTTTDLAPLSGLTLSDGPLAPAFSSINTSYTAAVPYATSSITVTPVCTYATSTVRVNGMPVASGTASPPLNLAVGGNVIAVVVSAADGGNSKTYTLKVTRLPAVYAFNSATGVPVTVSDLIGTGHTATFALGYAPAPGTRLTVVKNTGGRLIQGRFDNLTQGQMVNLTYGGVTYAFAANYFGGTGNDLVLQWANTRLLAWGSGAYGSLGNNSSTQSPVPVAVDMNGVLAGKTAVATVAGHNHNLVLCADGTLAAWGSNSNGQLGDGSTTNRNVPVLVDRTGVLAGKAVVALAAGESHSLALCTDGTVASWGNNENGQLGNNSTTNSSIPVEVNTTGVLSGKTVRAISAGNFYSLALCADGTVATWGRNYSGQLGDGTITDRETPGLVDLTGVLAGKTVAAIAAGANHTLALCEDGALGAWGNGFYGQLGNGASLTDIPSPVLVDRSGTLAGRTVAALAAGGDCSIVLCADGTLASWGNNQYGQSGNNGTTFWAVTPSPVNVTGLLAAKTITGISASLSALPHILVWCSDGSLAAWGYNSNGQLGNNSTTQSTAPVLVNTNGLAPGVRFMAAASGAAHSLGLVGWPLPAANSRPASAITGIAATLNGIVNAKGNATTALFEYGLDESYGNTVAATPGDVAGASDSSVSAVIGGLTPGTVYHFRVVGSSAGGVVRGADMTFTTASNNAKLAALGLSAGMMVPGFEKLTTSYVTAVPFATDGVTVTAATEHPAAAVQVNGVQVASGAASGVIPLVVGDNTLTTVVTAGDGLTTMSYVITVTRLPESFVFNSASDIPLTANGFAAGAHPVNIVLDYAPTPGTVLTMVKNTALDSINGMFGNLAQGQRVTLNHGGKDYYFAANYYGGTGNDLVLQWAANEVLAWGGGKYGQLGNDDTTDRLLPTSVINTGALSGKTITAVSGGYLHSLALCSDGTLAAWGYNVHGQLGNGGTDPSNVPVAVDRSGALAGKSVIAISAGPFHNLALCVDGSIVAWGYNNYGQLGNGDTATSRVPVLVNPVGALAGRHVVAVAAAAYHSFALCDDGTVAGWGYNDEGELGDGGTVTRMVPVALDMTGALAGKRVVAISAGQYHTLALCTDGTLVAWGYNQRGQLGNGSTTTSGVPVAIGSSGVLAGKTVTSIRASNAHSLALCADGTLAAWGYNHRGQLGTGDVAQSNVPVAVDLSGIESGKVIAGLGAGLNHGLLRFSDGSLAAWGDNSNGQLGDNSTTRRATAGPVDVGLLDVDSRFMMMVGSGSAASHNLAVVALPELDAVTAELWLQGIGAASGLAGDELIRHAFGLAAGEGISGQLPQPQRIGDDLVIRFIQPAGVEGLTYGAEWSETLLPGSWTAVPDTGSGGEHVFVLPMGDAPNLFIRLKVSER